MRDFNITIEYENENDWVTIMDNNSYREYIEGSVNSIRDVLNRLEEVLNEVAEL